MRDLLRYMLIAVLVVVVGWFLIGELKEWTIVDNSVNIESDGWELLFDDEIAVPSNDSVDIDLDYKGYTIVAFQINPNDLIYFVDKTNFYADLKIFYEEEFLFVNFFIDYFRVENYLPYGLTTDFRVWGVK